MVPSGTGMEAAAIGGAAAAKSTFRLHLRPAAESMFRRRAVSTGAAAIMAAVTAVAMAAVTAVAMAAVTASAMAGVMVAAAIMVTSLRIKKAGCHRICLF